MRWWSSSGALAWSSPWWTVPRSRCGAKLETLAARGVTGREIVRWLKVSEGRVRHHVRRKAQGATDGSGRQARRAVACRSAVGTWTYWPLAWCCAGPDGPKPRSTCWSRRTARVKCRRRACPSSPAWAWPRVRADLRQELQCAVRLLQLDAVELRREHARQQRANQRALRSWAVARWRTLASVVFTASTVKRRARASSRRIRRCSSSRQTPCCVNRMPKRQPGGTVTASRSNRATSLGSLPA